MSYQYFRNGTTVVVGTPYPPAKALWVGGAGNVTVQTPGGYGQGGSGSPSTITFTAVAAGTLLPVETVQVTAATATNMVALR